MASEVRIVATWGGSTDREVGARIALYFSLIVVIWAHTYMKTNEIVLLIFVHIYCVPIILHLEISGERDIEISEFFPKYKRIQCSLNIAASIDAYTFRKPIMLLKNVLTT